MVNPVEGRVARHYEGILKEHLAENRQMGFVSGPRQVGKTTLCRGLGDVYLDWDNENHRELILKGPDALAGQLSLDELREGKPVLVLDELHKYSRWKSLLKGFFDTYGDRCRVLVTGSSRLDVFKRGGDSLMGRYFVYRMHPFGVSELLGRLSGEALIIEPRALENGEFEILWDYGPFPEPFLKRSARFSNRWQRLRRDLLFKEDLRELTRIQELGQVEVLGRMLAERSGEQLVYSGLSRALRVDDKTVRSWVAVLESLHYGFRMRPWFRNVTRSLRKEPKWFLRDWSLIADKGQRAETMIACHLLKAVEGWTDLGLGNFELCYLRDKEKREVDFVVSRDGEPWFLVEVKLSPGSISPSLSYFQEMLGAEHAFQVTVEMDFVERDCFELRRPVIVPARTFLSQLSV